MPGSGKVVDAGSMRPVSEFLAGLRLLLTGFTLVLRRRRLFWLGVIPPLVMSLLFGGLFAALLINLQRLADWLTPFADGWVSGAEQAAEFVAGAGVLGGTALVMIVSFTTLTLAFGAPIYDQISEHVDADLEPGLKAPEETWGRAIGREPPEVADPDRDLGAASRRCSSRPASSRSWARPSYPSSRRASAGGCSASN